MTARFGRNRRRIVRPPAGPADLENRNHHPAGPDLVDQIVLADPADLGLALDLDLANLDPARRSCLAPFFPKPLFHHLEDQSRI